MPRGKIASLVAEKGFGFIKPTSGGDDLFFHGSTIDQPLDKLAIGQEVDFEIDTSAPKPRARRVATRGELLKKTGGDRPRRDAARSKHDRRKPGGVRGRSPQSGRQDRRHAGKGRPGKRDVRRERSPQTRIVVENGKEGTIASVRPEKGFGFIKPGDGGDDLFFHHSAIEISLEKLLAGQPVEYEIDGTSEKPRAGKVAMRGELLTKESQLANRPPHEIEHGHLGTVASVVVEKGFGFIAPADGGEELFFHDSVSDRALELLVSGQEVEYEIDQDAEKARASKVAIRGEVLTKERQTDRKPTVIANGRLGEVTSLVVEKRFGFIRPQDGGEDLFFHNSTVDYPFELLAVGQQVEFAVDETADKPRAKQVAVRGEILSAPRPAQSAARYPRSKFERGYVTKMLWKTRQGFISADQGGPELLFDQADVVGDKKYNSMQIGDYVEFVRTGEMARTKIDKAPTATAVTVVEKEIKKVPVKELPNNPRARRKKPTWRR